MLDRLRARLDGTFTSMGRTFARTGVSPTGLTVVGFTVSLLSGVAFWSSGYRGSVVGGVLILVSGFFDVADGAVARVTGTTSKRGAFLDSTLDRLAEVAVFAGILAGGYSNPLIVLFALSFSLLVSYTRARAESLGKSLAGVGIGERSERLLALSVAAILGLVSYGVIIVALLAAVTFAERTYRGAVALS